MVVFHFFKLGQFTVLNVVRRGQPTRVFSNAVGHWGLFGSFLYTPARHDPSPESPVRDWISRLSARILHCVLRCGLRKQGCLPYSTPRLHNIWSDVRRDQRGEAAGLHSQASCLSSRLHHCVGQPAAATVSASLHRRRKGEGAAFKPA